MDGNPLFCDKRLQWIKDGEEQGWLITPTDQQPQCANPPGHSWENDNLMEHTGAGQTSFTCFKTDPCQDNGCSENATCVADFYYGSFVCRCKTGFTGDGFVCSEVNQVADSCSPACSDNSECITDNGTPECSCKSGFRFTPDDTTECVDIDECEENSTICEGHFQCENTLGSYNCTCPSDYTLEGSTCIPPEGIPVLPFVIAVCFVGYLLIVAVIIAWYEHRKQKNAGTRIRNEPEGAESPDVTSSPPVKNEISENKV